MQFKPSLILYFFLIFLFCAYKSDFKAPQFTNSQAPVLQANGFKTSIKEGDVINCRKIKDLGVIMYFNEQMKKQELVQIELHRFGNNEDALVAFKLFTPESKEFQKKYARTDSVKLKLLSPENEYNSSDFEINTLVLKTGNLVNDVFCTLKDKTHCNFYLVVKGYNKTGKKNKFGEDEYDKGKELSNRSITFKNREDKTQ